MKRSLSLLLGLFLLLAALCSCAQDTQGDDTVTVVCTSFAAYDWARQILGDTEGTELVLLTDGGKDMHSYSPSAADIMRMIKCDLLISIGGPSEAWVRDLAEKNGLQNILYLLDVLGDKVKCIDHEDAEHAHQDHEHQNVDEHVWFSLKNAMLFCEQIKDRLCHIDSVRADSYTANFENYLDKLSQLDREYEKTVSAATHKTLVVADRYPYRYLFDDYGISCHAAFVGCSSDSEVSFSTLIFLSGKVDELALDSILITESSDGKLASTVRDSTKNKTAAILTLHSLQTVTDKNQSYLKLMEQNLEILRQALQPTS